MNVDDFYEEYKVTTKVENLVLKKVRMGTYVDETSSDSKPVLEAFPCLFFEFDITNVSCDQHPLEWFPQTGETKTVEVMVQGGFDSHGRCCIWKGAIL